MIVRKCELGGSRQCRIATVLAASCDHSVSQTLATFRMSPWDCEREFPSFLLRSSSWLSRAQSLEFFPDPKSRWMP